MIELFQYLSRLKSINLDLCSKLTNSMFFTPIRECLVLSEIRTESTNLGVEESTTELVIDPRIKSLHLTWNGNLSDKFMKKVAFVCPNLQLLNVSDCRIITEEGICKILKSCGEIQCLRIEQCRHINSLRIKHFEVKKLVVLQVGASGIDNDTLITIANTCPRLLYLNLSCCIYVTTRGVKEVVEKFTALREILLYFCQNVNANILLGIVFSMPSLRNIGWPYDEDISFPVYGIFDSIMVTNFGVVPLLRKLTNVTKIDLSGNKSITDKSIASILRNSQSLRFGGAMSC
ncbi:hypothetical protein ACOSQ3_009981 [Xanthoceras sorbifolium]